MKCYTVFYQEILEGKMSHVLKNYGAEPLKQGTDNNIETLFFFFEVLQPSQPNVVMSSAVSFTNHTFTGQA